jgi:protein PhnA
MSEELKKCPNCGSEYGYSTGKRLYACPECDFEWNPEEEIQNQEKVADANGNLLANGDNVVIIKDLPLKGYSKPLKSGTKVKNIRLVEGDHNIYCKIEGFGTVYLKSEFVKKV